jgi:hypothetical protein
MATHDNETERPADPNEARLAAVDVAGAAPPPPRPKAAPVPALTYERPPAGAITRGHVRWVLVLATVYVLMNVQNTYLPDVRSVIKDWWASRRLDAEHAEALQKARAFERKVMDFTEPPTKVVWEEDANAAAQLVAGAGYRWVPVEPLDKGARNTSYFANPDPLFAPWPRGARALPPPLLQQGPSGAFRINCGDEEAVVITHGRRAAAGAERLVVVVASGRQELGGINGGIDKGPPDQSWSRAVKKYQWLTASLYAPGDGETAGKMINNRSTVLLIHPESDPLATTWTYTPGKVGEAGKIDVPPRDRLRLFAGQPDPADAAHFTIAYDIDGQPGVVDGRLKDDDTVELKPTTGKIIGDRWYPHGK